MKKTTIEINSCDLQAFNLILTELQKARLKHPVKWLKLYERERKSIILEESIELIQAINLGDKENAKIEAAQYAVTAVRYLSRI